MRLSMEKRTTAFIITLALLILAVLLLVIYPTITKIKKLHRQTYDLRLFLEKKYEKSSRLHSSLSSIRRLVDETKNYSYYILPHGDELRLITMLEELAHKENVTQAIQSSDLDVSNPDYIDLSLSIRGPYKNTVSYLASLERNLPFFAIVKSMQFTTDNSRQNTSNSGNITVLSLNLRFYVKK